MPSTLSLVAGLVFAVVGFFVGLGFARRNRVAAALVGALAFGIVAYAYVGGS